MGEDSFTYYVTDEIADSAPATVTINVYNNPPIANDDGPYMTLHDIPLAVDPPGVLANDEDIDGDWPLEAYLDTAPTHGSVTLDTDGSFEYIPGGGYVGEDSFTYKAWDQLDYSDPAATVSIEVADMQLYSVKFEQDNQVEADPGVSPYVSPEWLDANQDGDADDPGDNKFPTSYVRYEVLSVSAVFHLDGEWQGGKILVYAVGPDSITVDWTEASVSGNVVSINNVQAKSNFPKVVKHYDDFNLNWFAKVQGQTAQIPVGTSSNDVYLTLAEPQGPMYHTVVHLGSHYAQGATTENDVVFDVWGNVFSNHTVERVDGMDLWYYHDYGIRNDTTEKLLTPISTTDGTLGDGKCQAWVSLMSDVLKTQGVTTHTIIKVAPDGSVISPAPQGFLVNSWSFEGAGSSDAAIVSMQSIGGLPLDRDQFVTAYPYMNVLQPDGGVWNEERNGYEFRFEDVTDGTGIPGKGMNSNPASIFANHGLIEYNTGAETVWFDPSYAQIYQGATQHDRELNFEDGGPGDPASIAGYDVVVVAKVRENIVGLDLNDDGDFDGEEWAAVMLVRPNNIGVREVVVQ